jgi:hypothetical protein
MGKLFLVVALSVGGLGNRIYHSGDVLPEEAFDAGNLESIIADGFITEATEKSKKDYSELEKAKKVLADKTAAASELANKVAELKSEADVADKDYQAAKILAESATEEDKESSKVLADEKFALASAAYDKVDTAEKEAQLAEAEVAEAQLAVDKLTTPKAKKK